MEIIPHNIVFRPDSIPYFTSINDIWYIAGRETLLPEGKIVTIKRTRRPEYVEVLIIKHVMKRQVHHQNDIEPTTYVLAKWIR